MKNEINLSIINGSAAASSAPAGRTEATRRALGHLIDPAPSQEQATEPHFIRPKEAHQDDFSDR